MGSIGPISQSDCASLANLVYLSLMVRNGSCEPSKQQNDGVIVSTFDEDRSSCLGTECSD